MEGVAKQMKKLAIILIFTVLLTGCYNTEAEQTPTTNDEVTTTSPTEQTDVLEEEYSLDLEYEQAIQACKSNADITKTNEEYAKKWYALSEMYCDNMWQWIADEDYFDEAEKERYRKIAESVETIHENWKQYAQQRCENERERVFGIYTTGSISGTLLSRFDYELYREHAIEMYNMCIQMHVDCPMP